MSKFDAVFKAKHTSDALEKANSPTAETEMPAMSTPLVEIDKKQNQTPVRNSKVRSKALKVESRTNSQTGAPVDSQIDSQVENFNTANTSDSPSTRRPGRPNAKRSHPDFVQTTAYIRKQTLLDVKMALLQAEKNTDFSELVEKLLSDWLKTQ